MSRLDRISPNWDFVGSPRTVRCDVLDEIAEDFRTCDNRLGEAIAEAVQSPALLALFRAGDWLTFGAALDKAVDAQLDSQAERHLAQQEAA